MVIDFQRENFAGAARARHGNAKQANRSAADHRYRLGGNLSGQNCVHGIAQWIEHAGIIRRNARINFPDI